MQIIVEIRENICYNEISINNFRVISEIVFT